MLVGASDRVSNGRTHHHPNATHQPNIHTITHYNQPVQILLSNAHPTGKYHQTAIFLNFQPRGEREKLECIHKISRVENSAIRERNLDHTVDMSPYPDSLRSSIPKDRLATYFAEARDLDVIRLVRVRDRKTFTNACPLSCSS
jgi:hypothetical protein